MSLFDAAGWYTKAVNYGSRKWRSPNFWQGNKGRKAFVLHVTDGDDSRGWLCNPASQVSAHFLVRTGEGIYQLVSIFDSSWANGIWENGHKWRGLPDSENPNRYTISCEREGRPAKPVPRDVNDWIVQLLRDLQEPYPQFSPYVPHQNLIGHYEISPAHRPNCPGPTVDFAQLATAANGAAPVAPDGTKYRVKPNVRASIRTSPAVVGTPDNVVRTLSAGATVLIDVVVPGMFTNGSNQWAHMATVDGVQASEGFIHIGALEVQP